MTIFVKSLSAVAVAVALMAASFGQAWAGAGGFGSKIYAAKIRSDGTHQAGTGGAGLVSSARLA